MKNVKLNSERIISDVIESNDFSAENVKSIIENLPWHKHLTLVDSETEAEEIFKNWFADSDGGAEVYMSGFCGVHSNCIEKFSLSIEHEDKTYNYEVSIGEYYVDSGSVDYIYGVTVIERY